jgi:misacylated tRNA(Ala) deacylase
VEDGRRTALMRTHSGLHVLCGVVFRDFGALVTGGNMDELSARMDFNLEAVPPGFKESVEEACNAELRVDRKIVVRSLPRAEAFDIPDIIRTATNLVPDDVKDVRIVDIVGLDQQADGGTHVASTAAVGRISVVKVENKGKGFRRLRIAIGDLWASRAGCGQRSRSWPAPARPTRTCSPGAGRRDRCWSRRSRPRGAAGRAGPG